MILSFKQMVFSLVKLPLRDQHWILKRLSSEEKERFAGLNGFQLLKEAQRFKKISKSEILNLLKNPPLPSFSKTLKTKDPLYIAIILNEGRFSWTPVFLHQYDEKGLIQKHLQHSIPRLKMMARQCIFESWQRQETFEHYLEKEHG